MQIYNALLRYSNISTLLLKLFYNYQRIMEKVRFIVKKYYKNQTKIEHYENSKNTLLGNFD